MFIALKFSTTFKCLNSKFSLKFSFVLLFLQQVEKMQLVLFDYVLEVY